MLNKSLLITLLASAISSTAFATSKEAPDRDLDNDGLIEINNWADLNEIRNNTSGKLYGSNLGCPTAGCTGYELTADLDFDTNGDGKLDANDTYWNEGLGWLGLGSHEQPFSAVLDGNGHSIRNLMINRLSGSYNGLFAVTLNARIQNLGLTGRLMSIGDDTSGGLIGDARNTDVINCFATGDIFGGTVGGLVGSFRGGKIIGSFTTGSVTGDFDAGGLVGRIESYSGSTLNLQSVFSTAKVSGAIAGGLIGFGDANVNASYSVGKVDGGRVGGLFGLGYMSGANNFWATDSSGRADANSGGSSSVDTPATLEQLKCPTTADDTACLSGAILYASWGAEKDSNGNTYWDFGTNIQLPGLVLNGVVYRDSDGNGVLDLGEPNAPSSRSSAASSSVETGSSLSSAASSSASNSSSVNIFASSSSSALANASASSSPASSTPTSTTALSSTAAFSSAPAASPSATLSSSAAAPVADTKSAGGSVNLLMLVLLSGLGLAWRGKKTSQC